MPVAQEDDAATAMALLARLNMKDAPTGTTSDRKGTEVDVDALDNDLDILADDIATLMTRVYEIQEIRHASSTLRKLDDKLQALDSTLETLSTRLETISTLIHSCSQEEKDERDLESRLLTTEQSWKDAVEEDAVLREELREDRWLVVFRTAAEQADDMVNSLQKAINQCSEFIEAAEGGGKSPSISLEALEAVEKSYAAKKKFYVPSVTKSLSILDKGIKERVTKNGETLRRHADMKRRWNETTNKLAQIDAQLPVVKHQLSGQPGLAPTALGSQELLTSPESSNTSLPDDPWNSPPMSRSGSFGTPRSDSSNQARGYGRMSSSLTLESANRPLRRRPSSSAISSMSDASTSAAARPPWNASPRIVTEPGPASSPSIKAAVRHSATKRLNSLYSVFGGNRRASSPGASSNASTTTVDSSKPPSRLPVPSPRRVVSSPRPPTLQTIPPVPPLPSGLTSPPAHAKGFERANAAYLRSSMMTPEPVLRQRATQMPFYTSSRSSNSGTPGRPEPGQSRASLGTGSRAPPSAYRATTPTHSRAGAATPSMERPRAFVPNPIDQLDLEVARLLAAHPGELFVQRTDPPLRANQLRAGHEWKGEIIFGGGKVVQCRLLELAKVGKGGGRSRKVMVRIGGVWMELSTYLAKL